MRRNSPMSWVASVSTRREYRSTVRPGPICASARLPARRYALAFRPKEVACYTSGISGPARLGFARHYDAQDGPCARYEWATREWTGLMDGRTSALLQDRLRGQNGLCGMKISFVDIVSYSSRRTIRQLAVISHLLRCIRESLAATSVHFEDDLTRMRADLEADVVVYSSGDGAALAFPYPTPHDIHLFQVLSLLEILERGNTSDACPLFAANGWCDCHLSVAVRCGLSEGQVVLYPDLNGGFGMAGETINIASRVMDLGGAGHIMMTKAARDGLFDFSDTMADEDLHCYPDVEIKHGRRIEVYQYIAEGFPGLNRETLAQVGVHAARAPWAAPTDPDRAPSSSGTPPGPPLPEDLVVIPGGMLQVRGVSVAIPGPMNVGRHPVTQDEWETVMGPRKFAFPGGDRPADSISWHDAVAYCNERSDREGFERVYQGERKAMTSDRSRNGYRLLTDAEWQYCCVLADDPSVPLAQRAWFRGNSARRDPTGRDVYETHPVGVWTSPLGLSDLFGNVREWCNDWYSGRFPSGSNDPGGPDQGDRKVQRGGAYNDDEQRLRVDVRFRANPSEQRAANGFRVTRRPVTPSTVERGGA